MNKVEINCNNVIVLFNSDVIPPEQYRDQVLITYEFKGKSFMQVGWICNDPNCGWAPHGRHICFDASTPENALVFKFLKNVKEYTLDYLLETLSPIGTVVMKQDIKNLDGDVLAKEGEVCNYIERDDNGLVVETLDKRHSFYVLEGEYDVPDN